MAEARHNGGVGGNSAALAADALIADLDRLRKAGLAGARTLALPALAIATEQTATEPAMRENVQIESLLRTAIAALDQGEYGDAATALFGLGEGMRAWSPARRRARAAQLLEISADRFQRAYERKLLADIGDKIVALAADQQSRQARVELERRHPAESRLAVQWVERFEAYYRLWTPAWGLAADLTAYRSTLLDQERPYDEVLLGGDIGYTQEDQAEGYAVNALYRWAWFQWELRQFMLQRGGMWLLSTSEAETRVADLVYEIGWHVTVFNERDGSWLRNVISQTRGQELDHFQSVLASTATGSARLLEWLEWCSSCECIWTSADQPPGRFPTSQGWSEVAESCQVHQVVEACDNYCSIIDEEWLRIADWYHIGKGYDVGKRSRDLYREWRERLSVTKSLTKG